MRKAVFGILITIVVLGAGVSILRYFYQKQPVQTTGQENTRYVPDKTQLTRLSDGKKIALDSFKGKVVLINFWASWCEACMAEMPSINKLYEKMKSEGLEVVAINVDDKPSAVVPEIVKKLGLGFPIYVDQEGKLTQYFDVMAIPFSAVLAKDQRILWAESGERDWVAPEVIEELRKAIK